MSDGMATKGADVKIRCKTCGKDHAYSDDVERKKCETCGTLLTLDNTRMIIPPSQRSADPLADF